jgi:putative salt-induced outer membrane protein YdiY
MPGITRTRISNSLRPANLAAALPLLALLQMPAQAQWSGGLEAGTQFGSSQNPTLRFYARHNGEPMTHYIYLDWAREDNGNSFRLGYNPVFNMSRSFYSFGKFSIEEDADSIVDQQVDALVGLGNHIRLSRESLLTIEVGGGARQLLFDNEREDETSGFLFLGGNYSRILFNTFRFNATVESRTGETQDTLDAEAGISYRLSDTTALKYAYRYRRSDVDGLESIVDEDSYFALTYGF